MRLMTLATVNAGGEPDARILVLRGASRDLGRLWFHTDRRSRKVGQLKDTPLACAIAYDGRDGVQLRVWGGVSLHADDEIAERHWEQTDFAVRHQYGMTDVPGEPLPHPDPRSENHRRDIAIGDEALGRANFMVLQLAAERIEWFQTTALGDRRAMMRAAGEWMVVPLVP